MTTRVRSDDFNLIPEPKQHRRHTWVPHNLIDLAKSPPEPPSIGGILYPGKRTLISGETESLKTWLALILAKAEMEIGATVGWVDLDDMGAGAILQRLRALQVPEEHIRYLFLYYQPEERLKDDVLDDTIRGLISTQTRLMIIDAFTPMLHLHGLDPNISTDIEAFWIDIADPIAKTGAAPVLLDHVVKTAGQRGKYATGSERKASGATVHIGTSSLGQLRVGGSGRALLSTHKDRPGYLPRPNLGVLVLTSDGERIGYQLDPDTSHTDTGFRPTVLMARISKTLQITAEPASQKWIEDNVRGNRDAIRTAVTILHREGYLEHAKGPRNSSLFTSLKPYDEASEIDLAQPRPDLAQGDVGFGSSSTSPPRPSPSEEGEVEAKSDWASGEVENSPPRPTDLGEVNGRPFYGEEPD